MDDKELLDKAARAAGIRVSWGELAEAFFLESKSLQPWNPLEDDGDALRLAVRLNILNTRSTGYEWPVHDLFVEHEDDPFASTRRAIVRAAAALA